MTDNVNDELNERLRTAMPAAPPSVAELSAIVRRATRARRRLVPLAALPTIAAVGALLGVILAGGSATPPSTTSGLLGAQLAVATLAQQAREGGGPPSNSPSQPSFTRLFVRTTTDGVAIRGYLVTPPSSFSCTPKHILVAELSNSGAVGMGLSAVPDSTPAKPVELIGAGVLGAAEGSPAMWIGVRTTSDVARVQAHWASGHVDEMAPTSNLAILADDAPPTPATITAFASNGSQLASISFPPSNHVPSPPECHPPASVAKPPAPGGPSGRPGPSRSGSQPGQSASPGALGVLQSSSADSLTLKVQAPESLAGQTIVVKVPAGTPVALNGQPSTLSALRAGYEVGVRMTQQGSTYIAQQIEARFESGA